MNSACISHLRKQKSKDGKCFYTELCVYLKCYVKHFLSTGRIIAAGKGEKQTFFQAETLSLMSENSADTYLSGSFYWVAC